MAETTGRGEIRDVMLETLQALSEQSLRRATESVSALLGHPVRLEVSGVRALALEGVSVLTAESDSASLAGLRFQIAGEGGGHIVILFPLATIFRMLRALLGTPEEPRPLSDQERSAVGEVGNILASSFLSALGDRLGKRLLPTPPEIHIDAISRLMQPVVADLRIRGAGLLVVQARFQDPEQRIEGRFYLVPELTSLEALTGSPPRPGGAGGGDETRRGEA